MFKFKEMIILIVIVIWILRCAHCRKRKETIQRYNKTTGENTATDDLILKYERAHRNFYDEEIGDGEKLMWPALNDTNLSNYCKKYLYHSVPTRTTENAVGAEYEGTLIYEKENISSASEIVVVQCKIMRRHPLCYYITRAPEPNCVYALRCVGFWAENKFAIIHKHCNFESKQFREMVRKRKTTGIINKMHPQRAEPIAKDKYLLVYELEHQELMEKEGGKGKEFEWPYAMEHHNLNSYCYQYVKECILRRQPKSAEGSWKIGKLNYQKLNKNKSIYVAVVKCHLSDSFRGNYHMTRAPQMNCVYALARQSCGDPFVIIFKHCNFEEKNYGKPILQDHDRNIIPKTEVKKELCNTLVTLPLFPPY